MDEFVSYREQPVPGAVLREIRRQLGFKPLSVNLLRAFHRNRIVLYRRKPKIKGNRKPGQVRLNPLRADPTRTGSLRNRFARELRQRFVELGKEIYQVVVTEDAFGLVKSDGKIESIFTTRPQQFVPVDNVYCATGPGGGKDPTCSPGGKESTTLRLEMKMPYGTLEQRQSGILEVYKNASKRELKNVLKNTDPDEVSLKGMVDFDGNSYVWEVPRGSEGVNHARLAEHLGMTNSFAMRFYVESGKDGEPVAATHKGINSSPLVKAWAEKEDIAANSITTNDRWRFHSDPEKINTFSDWLRRRILVRIFRERQDALLRRYIEEGFKRGAGRAFDDTKKARRFRPGEGEFYRGSKEQFLRDSFGHPETVEKLKILIERTFTDLVGVTEQMATVMRRTLADGLVTGANPRTIAKALADNLEGIGINRAEMISRSEIIRAHAEGQLQAMKDLGVEQVGVAVEWSSARDGRVCPKCKPLHGIVLSLDEARGMIPRHPQCRCSWIPANVGETDKSSKRSQTKIEQAIAKSVALDGGPDETTWAGADKDISGKRPKSILDNVYCPTGEGGGKDPTCKMTGYHAKTKGGFSGGTPSVDVGSDYDILGKGFYFGTKEYASRYGEPSPFTISGKLATGDQWKSVLAKHSKKRTDRQRAASRSDLAGAGYVGVWTGEVGVVWDQKALVANLDNVFCPTGEGGGVDPTCSPGQTGSSVPPVKGTGSEADIQKSYIDDAAKMADNEFVQRSVERLLGKMQAHDARWSAIHKKVTNIVDRSAKLEKIHQRETDKLANMMDADVKAGKEGKNPVYTSEQYVEQGTKCDLALGKFLKHRREGHEKAWKEVKKGINNKDHQFHDAEYSMKAVSLKEGYQRYGPLNDLQKASIKEVEAKLSGVITTRLRERVEDTVVFGLGEKEKQRAYFKGTRHQANEQGVYLPINVNAQTVAHELGHSLETHFGVYSAARGFLYHRVGKEAAKAIPNHEVWEVGRDDRFSESFGSSARYVGKHYKSDDTEIVSMGMEKMLFDTVHFAKTDPEYFKFMVGVLDGSFAQ